VIEELEANVEENSKIDVAQDNMKELEVLIEKLMRFQWQLLV
jgi:hypothetical protein